MAPSSISKAFGRRLKAVREERGLSQAKLGKRCKLTVSELSRYENGAVAPTIESFVRIATALEVSADTLVFGNAPPVLDQPRNLELWSIFVEVEKLNKADQNAVVRIIEAMAAQRRMKDLVEEYGHVSAAKKRGKG